MGLLFRSRRRRSGLGGLLMLVVVCMVAMVWIARHGSGVQTSCMNRMQAWGMSNRLCDMVASLAETSSTIFGRAHDARQMVSGEALGEQWSQLSERLDLTGLRERWAAINYRIDQGQSWMGGNPLASYTSMEAVQAMLRGGRIPGIGGGAGGRLQFGMNNFTAGQMRFSENPVEALQWYRRGADMGEYGLLSQLKLGSLYMGGAQGVAPDYAQAYQYNARALHSLDALQASNTPEAQTLLRGLPVEPSQLKLQLQDTLQRLQQAH